MSCHSLLSVIETNAMTTSNMMSKGCIQLTAYSSSSREAMTERQSRSLKQKTIEELCSPASSHAAAIFDTAQAHLARDGAVPNGVGYCASISNQEMPYSHGHNHRTI